MQLLEQGLRAVRDMGMKLFTFDHLSKDVDAGLYAATVRGILLHHIHVMKRVVTYGELAKATTSLPKGGQLAQALQRIAEDDFQAKRPLSTAIVIGESTDKPGAGFFKQARELGLLSGMSLDDEDKFWKSQLQLLDVAIPQPDLQKEALKKVAEIVGKDPKDEMSVLEEIWDASRLTLASVDRVSMNHEELALLMHDTVGGRDRYTTKRMLGNPLPADERAAQICAKQGFLLIPPKDLKVGDVVLNVIPDKEVTVEAIASYTKVGHTPSHRRPSLSRDIYWTAGGEEYVSPAIGIHLKVRRTVSTGPLLEEAPDLRLPTGDAETLERARLRKPPRKRSRKTTP